MRIDAVTVDVPMHLEQVSVVPAPAGMTRWKPMQRNLPERIAADPAGARCDQKCVVYSMPTMRGSLTIAARLMKVEVAMITRRLVMLRAYSATSCRPRSQL